MARVPFSPVAATKWRGVLLACVAGSTMFVMSCGDASDAKKCVEAGDSHVCAWRDGAVRVSTEGLAPGSSFRYVATVSGGEPIDSPPDLVVGEDGTVPGALGVLSAFGGEVTLEITAVAEGGSPLVGRIVVA